MFPLHTSQESNKTHTSDTLFMDFLWRRKASFKAWRRREYIDTGLKNLERLWFSMKKVLEVQCQTGCHVHIAVQMLQILCFFLMLCVIITPDHISFYAKSLIHITYTGGSKLITWRNWHSNIMNWIFVTLNIDLGFKLKWSNPNGKACSIKGIFTQTY